VKRILDYNSRDRREWADARLIIKKEPGIQVMNVMELREGERRELQDGERKLRGGRSSRT